MRSTALTEDVSRPARAWRTHAAMLGLVGGAAAVLAILLACASTPQAGLMRKGAEPVAPPPPPPPPLPAQVSQPDVAPTPRGAGCVKDMDCKGDRLCERGECVAPK